MTTACSEGGSTRARGPQVHVPDTRCLTRSTSSRPLPHHLRYRPFGHQRQVVPVWIREERHPELGRFRLVDQVRRPPERDTSLAKLFVCGVDIFDAEVDGRSRAELLALGHTEVQANTVAVEEGHLLARNGEQELDPENVSVERDRAVDVGHAEMDLSDPAEALERQCDPPSYDRRAMTSAVATRGIASESHRNARSGASRMADASIRSRVPSLSSTSPWTPTTVRRRRRTGVDSVRCAAEIAAHAPAASTASTRTTAVCAKYAVRTGNAPQASANHRSECTTPPNSSMLYATTRNAPATMNAHSHGETSNTPCTPNAIAPPRPTTAMAIRTPPGMRVRSGRPLSSSRAWAARPIAKKKAASVSRSHPTWRWGASAAPIATYERCHTVYGGW